MVKLVCRGKSLFIGGLDILKALWTSGLLQILKVLLSRPRGLKWMHFQVVRSIFLKTD